MVELDTADVEVGVVLSQRVASEGKLHPCAIFSCRFLLAETIHDIGNCGLLSVKLALEEWRHWLEGAKIPFLVWTGHINLWYISSGKRLNSHQA